ncbi:MAG: hypothetical protein ABI651_17365 [Verrucomicrobiota bacterium]
MLRYFGSLFLVAFLTGCGDQHPIILGKPPEGSPRSIANSKATDSSGTVTVRGVMVEKCPVAGCWFILRDQTGRIKVDTKGAGFVVLDVALRTTVTVTGKIAANGAEKIIEASGLRY